MDKRVDYIDILRGIGIIYMMLGHIKLYPVFDHYIHAFHMPLFFFVTGLFLKRSSDLTFPQFLKKITKQLLIPYLIWGLFFWLYACFTKEGLINNWFQTLSVIFTVNNDVFPIGGALWYLTCLYFCQIIMYLLSKFIKNEIIFGIICLSLMIIGIYYNNITDIKLWWSLNVSLVSVGIVYIGYIIKKYQIIQRITNTNIVYTLIIFVINYIIIMKSDYVNMRVGLYPNPILFVFNFLLSMIVYINISKIILKINKIEFFTSKIKFIGKNSISFLCLNQFAIHICNKILNKFGISNFIINILGIPEFIYIIFIFILVVIVLYFFTKFIMKNKLKVIFGK